MPITDVGVIRRAMRPCDAPPLEGRRRPITCLVAGCGRSTREGKPYCSQHVEHHPYVRAIVDQLAAHEREVERIRQQRGARVVNTDGLAAQELIRVLAVLGPRTVQRLARDLNLPRNIVPHYVRALRRARFVTVRETRRRTQIVGLTDAGALHARSLFVSGEVVAPIGGLADKPRTKLKKPVPMRRRRAS